MLHLEKNLFWYSVIIFVLHICVADPVQLQAKFRVTNGPSHLSKAVVTFDCEGASVSGLGLELQGSGYKVYLFKERCQAGEKMPEVIVSLQHAYTRK